MSRRPARRRAMVVLVGLLLAAAAGCGVPVEDAPRDVPTRGVPYPAQHGSVPAAGEVGAAEEPLFFVRGDKLVRAVRRVRVWPTVETQVQHLLAGPSQAERDDGMTSALTGTTTITGIRLAGGQATVEIADNRDEPGRSDEVLAFGQIVCTLTTRPDVTGVAFESDGQRLDVPRADGSLSQGPLTAADYASLTSR